MKHIRNRVCSAGFTLIELLVVCTILIIITTVMMANHSRFGSSVQLQNLAYDVALSVRQAQVYGISVARFGSSTSYTFNTGYGMHFNNNSSVYTLFADALTVNGMFDSSEQVVVTNIAGGYYVKDLCASPSSTSTETCGYTSMDIVFKRPEPGAWISAGGTSCILSHASCSQKTRIVLSSPKRDTMSVTVWANGQISVQQSIVAGP